MRVKWTASGRHGRRGQPVTPTVGDIDDVDVNVRRRRSTTDATVTATTSTLTTAPNFSVPVRLLTHNSVTLLL